jgi:DNA-directed RNA polymerase specialized sigma subunit
MNNFIEEYMPLIKFHVKNFSNSLSPDQIAKGVDNDLLAVGEHGVKDALHSFKSEGGANLKTHISNRIENAIQSHLDKIHPIPKNIRDMAATYYAKNPRPASEGRGPQPIKNIHPVTGEVINVVDPITGKEIPPKS